MTLAESYYEQLDGLERYVITAIRSYAEVEGLPFAPGSLKQMSIPLRDTLNEVLMFGMDRWPILEREHEEMSRESFPTRTSEPVRSNAGGFLPFQGLEYSENVAETFSVVARSL